MARKPRAEISCAGADQKGIQIGSANPCPFAGFDEGVGREARGFGFKQGVQFSCSGSEQGGGIRRCESAGRDPAIPFENFLEDLDGAWPDCFQDA